MITQYKTFSRVLYHMNARTMLLPHQSQIDSYTFAILYRQLSFKSSSFGLLGKAFRVFPQEKGHSFLSLLKTELKELKSLFKLSSVLILRSCMQQFEFVAAHKIRRGHQFLTLYTNMWNENALKVLLNSFRSKLFKHGKEVLVSASVVAFNWEKDRITDEELQKHMSELDLCYLLRKRANQKAEPCTSPECQCSECKTPEEVKSWSPFINKDELTVWKMEETNYKGTGLFCYKMYGKYDDVVALDFFKVFLDTENRKKWDSHAVTLEVIDKEPATNSDVLYWETKWPKLFSNRDYVFTRRFIIDQKRQVMIIMNKSANHPKYPEYNNKSRVHEYWSYMVIKPLESFDKEGIEFSLTYFDNPGITLPSAISLWVTVTGMPEYLKKLRSEALKLAVERSALGVTVDDIFTEAEPALPCEAQPDLKKKSNKVWKNNVDGVENDVPPSDKNDSDKDCNEKDSEDKSKLPPKKPPSRPPGDPPFKQPLDPIAFWITCMRQLKSLSKPREPVMPD